MNIQLTIHLPEAIQKILTAAMVKEPTESDKPTESVNEPLRPTYRRLKFRGKTIRGLLIDNIEWYVAADILDALEVEGVIEREVILKGINNDTKSCEIEGEEHILVDRFGAHIIKYFCHGELKEEFNDWFFSKASRLYTEEEED